MNYTAKEAQAIIDARRGQSAQYASEGFGLLRPVARHARVLFTGTASGAKSLSPARPKTWLENNSAFRERLAALDDAVSQRTLRIAVILLCLFSFAAGYWVGAR